MTNEEKELYFIEATDPDVKLLYSKEFMPCNDMLCEYQGINADYILHYEMHELEGKGWHEKHSHMNKGTNKERMEAKWKNLLNYIRELSAILFLPFKDKIACRVEGRQNYRDWGKDDIILLLECIGKASRKLYNARRDWLICNYMRPKGCYPLAEYYVSSLEYITWLSATFTQSDPGNFIDLVTKLRGKAK